MQAFPRFGGLRGAHLLGNRLISRPAVRVSRWASLSRSLITPGSQSVPRAVSAGLQCNVAWMSSKARGFDPEAWGRGKTPYEILGCAKSASAKELKLAYYKAAKLHHPDANPDDAEGAKARFQYVSAAYELLSDDRKRKEYDAGATAWGAGASRGEGGGNNYNRQQSGAARDWKARQEQANNTTSGYNQQWYRQTNSYNSYGASSDMFNFITTEDVDVLKEAFADYETELKEDVEYAMDCVHHGEYKEALSVVSQYKGLVLGVVLPAALLLRFPGLVAAATIAVFRFSSTFYVFTMRVIIPGMAVLAELGFAQKMWRGFIAKIRDKIRTRVTARAAKRRHRYGEKGGDDRW